MENRTTSVSLLTDTWSRKAYQSKVVLVISVLSGWIKKPSAEVSRTHNTKQMRERELSHTCDRKTLRPTSQGDSFIGRPAPAWAKQKNIHMWANSLQVFTLMIRKLESIHKFVLSEFSQYVFFFVFPFAADHRSYDPVNKYHRNSCDGDQSGQVCIIAILYFCLYNVELAICEASFVCYAIFLLCITETLFLLDIIQPRRQSDWAGIPSQSKTVHKNGPSE